MALNSKNAEVDRLASEVASLARESKTEAVRKSLLERKAGLIAQVIPQKRSERAASVLSEFRTSLPAAARGKRLTRPEEDAILGFGPGGV